MRRRLVNFVNHLFSKHAFLANTATCGSLLCLGDAVQQGIEWRGMDAEEASGAVGSTSGAPPAPSEAGEGEFRYDWGRTARMGTVGMVLGPLSHWWYGVLDRLYPKATLSNVVRKILLDQTFGAPTFSLVFISGMSKLEGATNEEALKEFSAKFPFVYLVDWLVWPPAQALNFFLVPRRFRVAFVCFVDLCWYTFNSWVKHEREFLPLPEQVREILGHYENPRRKAGEEAKAHGPPTGPPQTPKPAQPQPDPLPRPEETGYE